MYLKRSLLHGIVTVPLLVGTVGAFAEFYPWLLVPAAVVAVLFWLWRYHRVELPASAARLLAPHLWILLVELVPWCIFSWWPSMAIRRTLCVIRH